MNRLQPGCCCKKKKKLPVICDGSEVVLRDRTTGAVLQATVHQGFIDTAAVIYGGCYAVVPHYRCDPLTVYYCHSTITVLTNVDPNLIQISSSLPYRRRDNVFTFCEITGGPSAFPLTVTISIPQSMSDPFGSVPPAYLDNCVTIDVPCDTQLTVSLDGFDFSGSYVYFGNVGCDHGCAVGGGGPNFRGLIPYRFHLTLGALRTDYYGNEVHHERVPFEGMDFDMHFEGLPGTAWISDLQDTYIDSGYVNNDSYTEYVQGVGFVTHPGTPVYWQKVRFVLALGDPTYGSNGLFASLSHPTTVQGKTNPNVPPSTSTPLTGYIPAPCIFTTPRFGTWPAPPPNPSLPPFFFGYVLTASA